MQPGTYLELLRLMGELRGAGEKGQRQLLISVLPRLAQMENLPTSLIPQLLQLLSTGSDRCATSSSFLLLTTNKEFSGSCVYRGQLHAYTSATRGNAVSCSVGM